MMGWRSNQSEMLNVREEIALSVKFAPPVPLWRNCLLRQDGRVYVVRRLLYLLRCVKPEYSETLSNFNARFETSQIRNESAG